MKLLANENVPLASVRALRELGQDVASITEDSPGVSDEEVVAFAQDENRVIVTFDRDYGRLVFHRGVSPPAGVRYLRFSPREPTEAADYVARLMADGIELQGRFTTADRVRIRQRLLRPEPNRRYGGGVSVHSGPVRTSLYIHTLIETAKMNGLDPQAWLTEVLHRIPDHPSNCTNELLPWNCKPDSAQSDAA